MISVEVKCRVTKSDLKTCDMCVSSSCVFSFIIEVSIIKVCIIGVSDYEEKHLPSALNFIILLTKQTNRLLKSGYEIITILKPMHR